MMLPQSAEGQSEPGLRDLRVEVLLRRGEIGREQALDGVGGDLDRHREVLALDRRVRLQDVILDGLPTGGRPMPQRTR